MKKPCLKLVIATAVIFVGLSSCQLDKYYTLIPNEGGTQIESGDEENNPYNP